MSRKTLQFGAVSLTLVLAALVAVAEETPKNTVLGSKEEAKWTQTTLEAATTNEHKKVLDSAKVATVTGEVVDFSCYSQLGKRGPAHAECGGKCVRAGQPAAILDDEGNVFLVVAEQHHPRRDGQVSLAETMAGLMSKRVTATGLLTETRGVRTLFLQAPPVAAPAAPVVPSAPAPPSAPAAN